MEIKITKRQVLDRWSNSTSAGEYTLVHGRAYNAAGDRYRPFKFVLWIDYACDLWDPETEEELKRDDVLEDMIDCFVAPAVWTDFCETGAWAEFIDQCNDTITRYNERNARYNRRF